MVLATNGLTQHYYSPIVLTAVILFISANGSATRSQYHQFTGFGRLSPNGQNRYRVSQVVNTMSEIMQMASSGDVPEIKDRGGGGGGGREGGGTANVQQLPQQDTSNNEDDDDKKTLSQQVSDGKYGLIQKELFADERKRPGIISYDINPEVPKDNINNLGGLEPDDIWLAENHLLVLAGGAFNPQGQGASSQWKPIDNYVAPQRPVQLSSHPKVPPPFPVQLTENGPVQFLTSVNGSKSSSVPAFMPFFNPFYSLPPSAIGTGSNNKTPPLQYGPPTYSGNNIPPGFSNPPKNYIPAIRPLFPSNQSLPPPLPPFFSKPSPGAEFLPPFAFANTSDVIDEDDPSLYYPPPYDFYYPKDDTSKVPAGPLVPGIVLPPPPNFFTLLANESATIKSNTKEPTGKMVMHGSPNKSSRPMYPRKISKQLSRDNQFRGYIPFRTTTESAPALRYPTTTDFPSRTKSYATYNDIINEVNYPDYGDNKLITFKSNEGWVPIPAPKPYYITGPRKPIKDTILMMDTPTFADKDPLRSGYLYQIPKTNFDMPHSKYNDYSATTQSVDEFYKNKNLGSSKYSSKFPKYFTSTSMPIFSTGVTKAADNVFNLNDKGTTTTVTSSEMFRTPIASDGKDVQTTYYFYEEPPHYIRTHFKDGDYISRPLTTTSRPFDIRFNKYDENFSLRPTIAPSIPVSSTTFDKTPEDIPNVTPISSTTPSFREEPNYADVKTLKKSKNRPPAPTIPIYYLADIDTGHHVPTSTDTLYETVKHYTYPSFSTTTSRPTYNINKPSSSLLKPTGRPIFEYSYTAPGYENQSEHPAIQIPEIAPISAYNDHNSYYPSASYDPYYRPNYDHNIYQFQSPPLRSTSSPVINSFVNGGNSLFDSDKNRYSSIYNNNNNRPVTQHKPSTEYITLDRPWSQKDNFNQQQIFYKTENPFYAFYTKEDEDLIDDNTKKYFSIFGQKIKQPKNEDAIRSTTPSIVSSSYQTPNIRFVRKKPTSTFQRIQSSSTSKPYQLRYNDVTRSTPALSNQEIRDISSAVPLEDGKRVRQSFRYNEDESKSEESAPPSLIGDTLVNDINQQSVHNPDSEYINVGENYENSKRIPNNNNLVNYNKITNDDEETSSEERENESKESSTKPPSLEGDTIVNYIDPRPAPNPDSEFINLGHYSRLNSPPLSTYTSIDPESATFYYTPTNYGRDSAAREQHEEEIKLISLEGDTDVNDKNHRPGSINPDSEYVDTSGVNKDRWQPQLMPAASLEGDTEVNYKTKRRPNPDAEWIKTDPNTQRQRDANYRTPGRSKHPTEADGNNVPHWRRLHPVKPISLHGDTDVNYKFPRPAINPDAEYITPNRKNVENQADSSHREVSYRYPSVQGDSHFYYLTPREASHRTLDPAREYRQVERDNYDLQSDAENKSGSFKRTAAGTENFQQSRSLRGRGDNTADQKPHPDGGSGN